MNDEPGGARPLLTPVEQELYDYLIDFLAENTYQPSVREIGKALKIPSTKSVTDLLSSLADKGYVERRHGRSRGVKLVGFSGALGTVPVPVVTLDPTTGTLRTEDHFTLDRRLVAAPDAFLVRSLTMTAPAHGLMDGDLALVHPSARARDGDLVVVRIGGALLVRPLARRGATLMLDGAGAGDDVELASGDDFEVLGVVAGAVRPPRTVTE